MKRKVLVSLTLTFMAMAVVGIWGCSSDDEDAQSMQCNTIRIRNIDDQGIVYGNFIDRPKETDLKYATLILFNTSDLSGLDVATGDELDVRILSYKLVPIEGYTTGDICCYFCNIRRCE